MVVTVAAALIGLAGSAKSAFRSLRTPLALVTAGFGGGYGLWFLLGG